MKILFYLFAFSPMFFIGPKTETSASKFSEARNTSKVVKRTLFNPLIKKQTISNQPSGTYVALNQNVYVCISNNGVYSLVLQTDGNLVLYKGSTSLWTSGTQNSSVRVLTFETFDPNRGTMMLKSNGGNQIYWNANVQFVPGASVSWYWILQDDGNFVRYSTPNNSTVATGTANGKKSSHNHRIE